MRSNTRLLLTAVMLFQLLTMGVIALKGGEVTLQIMMKVKIPPLLLREMIHRQKEL